MAAVTVQYILKLGGDLASKLPSLTSGVKALGSAAKNTASSVAAVGSAGRAGLNRLGETAGQAAEGALKAAAGFAALGFATHELLRHNDEYEQSFTRLRIAAQDLGTQISDTLGPKVAKVIDAFTIGFVYIANLILGSVGPAVEAITGLFDKFVERASYALEIWKRIASGDFAGAQEILEGHAQAITDMVGIIQTAFDKINAANDDAIQSAFAAWRRQVDGIKDVYTSLDDQAKAAEARAKMLRDSVTTIKGTSARQAANPAANFQDLKLEQPAGQSARQAASDSRTTDEIAKTTEAVDAVGQGVQGILGMIPVYGGFLASIWGVVSHLEDFSKQAVQEIIDFVTSFGDQLAATIEEVPQMVIDAIPEVVTSIAKLIPQLILSLISSGPQLFAALLEALVELPEMLVKGFGQMFKDFARDIKEAFGKIFDFGRDKEGHFLGTNFREAAGKKELFGIHVPHFDTGGEVTRSGFAYVHRGEVVNPAGRSSGGNTFHFHLSGADPDRMIREIRARLGTYGTGQSLEPLGR